MKMRNALLIAVLALLSACSAPYTDMKSPCVGIEGSPCERHPVNGWWLKDKENG